MSPDRTSTVHRRAKTRAPLSSRLFSEPEHPKETFIAYVDGASRGNPGPASYAVIIRASDGQVVFQLGKYLGRATNNVAEYYALITALDYAAAHNIRQLRVRSDSELLVRQMQGRYKVKSAVLKPLHERARRLAAALSFFQIEHVPRELNSDADSLANSALDQSSGRPLAAQAPASDVGPPTSKTIRAHFRNGALHPSEPLDLTEGEEVELTIKRNVGN